MTDFTNIQFTNIQSFLHSFPNSEEFQKFVLENGILFTVDSELDLMILRYNRENPLCQFTDNFTRFCRGLIIDSESRDIVCFPPEKNTPFQSMEYPCFSKLLIEDFIDGTMINVFHHRNQWHISTRSKIGADGTWFSKKKFSDMFSEAKGNMDFEKFEKNYTYTFVLRHPENRIVTRYESADLVLVQVRDRQNLQVCPNMIVKNILKERGIEVTIPVVYNFTDLEQLTHYISQMNWEQQGVVIKYGNQRSKMRNESYNYVKSMRGNNPKVFYNYLELRKNNMIKQYLQYFPEFNDEFEEYRKQVAAMTRLLHQTYMNYRVKKLITVESVPYELRPLVYELHGHHLGTKISITPDYVRNYFNSLPIKKIIFVVNYQKNQKIRN